MLWTHCSSPLGKPKAFWNYQGSLLRQLQEAGSAVPAPEARHGHRGCPGEQACADRPKSREPLRREEAALWQKKHRNAALGQ